MRLAGRKKRRSGRTSSIKGSMGIAGRWGVGGREGCNHRNRYLDRQGPYMVKN